MKKWIMEKLYFATKEDIFVTVFGLSFFVGIWYAAPMVNVITDVWAFGGGVLRAMESYTLLPGRDVQYGTISFYQNYFVMAVMLGIGWLFTGFNIEAIKTFLILNPFYSLVPSRITSVLTAIFLLFFVYRFLKQHVVDSWWRIALLVLVFGSPLAALLIRSGKMWVLSITLGIVSFIYLYRALTEEREIGIPGRLAFISIMTAFLATANFPFAAVFLINIPIIFLLFAKSADSLKRLILITLIGFIVFLGIVALNFNNTYALVSSFLSELLTQPSDVLINEYQRRSFTESLWVNVRHTIEASPILITALLVISILSTKSYLRDKLLLYLSFIYGMIWIIMVSVIFRTDQGLELNVRHIFPMAFFLLFAIASFQAPRRTISIVFLIMGGLLYVYTIVLFSIPTTYNSASDFIKSQYVDKEIRIDEYIFELTLPMNKASYEIFSDRWCGSTCQKRKQMTDDIDFRPVVVTNYADPQKIALLPPADIIVSDKFINGCNLIVRFGNNIPDDEVFDMDINLGRLLLPSFYKLNQLGKNIYVYDADSCSTEGFEN